MNDDELKNLLKDIRPPQPDENARKRAVNLAMAEYEAAKKENEKKFKGFSIARRLKGRTTHSKRRSDPMKKRYVYGGLATAMVVVLAATVSFQQLQESSEKYSGSANQFSVIAENIAGSVPQKSELNAVEFSNDGARTSSKPKRMKTARREGKAMGGRPPMAAQSMVMAEADRADIMPRPGYKDVGRDKFEDFEENPVKVVSENPVSTFSVDVDTSSYAFMRRRINNGVLPQKDAVRIEELINYFDYNYPLPETKDEPFKPTTTVVPSPWAKGKKLVHIGIKGYDIEPAEKPRSNLVFLLDVSGSMNAPDKLPLLKNSFKLLLDNLEPEDTVAIVVYAGAAGTVLEPTSASEKHKIISALENLRAGGSTAGAEGIRQAYNLAESNFDEDAVNRVMLATDGDFNVGITNRDELKDFVERKRESGIFLSVLGFGQGNLNDHMMQTLAQNGNGVAAYIDSLSEARKVLVEEASSTLFPIAKDVKIQVEFNPDKVAEYRLIGYETRALKREDFNNDAVDAGDIGSGHTVTAIYEITPVGGPRAIDDSRYGKTEEHKADTDFGDEYAFLKIRYKRPDEDKSNLITTPITTKDESELEKAGIDTRFATAVAAFGQLLKGSKYNGDYSYEDVIELAQSAKGDDPYGYRTEFVNLVRLAKSAAALEKSAPNKGQPGYPKQQPYPEQQPHRR
jgi:Ca-activated chloride channel family protein